MILDDVIIPYHSKDCTVINQCCESLKEILGVKRIFLISWEDPKIDGTIFINENDINQIVSYDYIHDLWKSKCLKYSHRTGWIYQQLLKLSANVLVPDISDNFLLCDADIIFVTNPYKSVDEGIFPYNNSFNNSDNKSGLTYFKLMKYEALPNFSAIHHNMVINKHKLSELKNYIESIHGISWDMAILDSIDYCLYGSFSEYDLYANWMLKKYYNLCQNIKIQRLGMNHVPSRKYVNDLRSNKIKPDILSIQHWYRCSEFVASHKI
jgi:hypothetical protein